MADIALVTANRVRIVESLEQATLPTAEAITAGQAVRIDTTTGKFTKSNATSAAESRVYGIATRTVAAGEPVTAVRRGLLDGFNFDSLDYDTTIWLSGTDGALADAAGAAQTLVGRVVPGTATTVGTAFDKLLLVDILQVPDAVIGASKLAMFVSTEQTGNGSAQSIAHGLGVTPAKVLVIPTDTAPATTGAYTATEGSHTSTNVVVTVTSGKKYKVVAFAA